MTKILTFTPPINHTPRNRQRGRVVSLNDAKEARKERSPAGLTAREKRHWLACEILDLDMPEEVLDELMRFRVEQRERGKR